MFTPHARGSTQDHGRSTQDQAVYPACAGIDPTKTKNAKNQILFTPHARGSTSSKPRRLWLIRVYPACAGIDRTSS